MRRRDTEPEPDREIDLHRMTVEAALRRLAQELHAARVGGLSRLRVITGRGWGSGARGPALTPAVVEWLAGDEARRLGVRASRTTHKGGAIEVDVGNPADA